MLIQTLVLAAVAAVLSGCAPAPVEPGRRAARGPVRAPESVEIADFRPDATPLSIALVEKTVLGEAGWRARLTPLGYAVLREKSTELPFTGRYDKHAKSGLYRCAGCGTALFASRDKFDSRTGWPSFTAPISPANVYAASDGDQDEVLCRRCDGHLGHVFPDGPAPGGLRYCINSAALRFQAAE